MVESPPADAGDTGSCPGPGGSHMPRRGWARGPWPLGLRIQSLCSAAGEATAVRGPCTTTTTTKNDAEESLELTHRGQEAQARNKLLLLSGIACYYCIIESILTETF